MKNFRHDRCGALPWTVIIVIIVVIVIVVAFAFLVLARPEESLIGSRPEKKDIAEISVTPKIGDFDNQWGQVTLRNVQWKPEVAPFEYSKYKGGWSSPSYRMASMFSDEFLVVCAARLTGPNGFSEMTWDTQHITVDDWYELWEGGDYSVAFKELSWYVSDPGRYSLTLEIVVSEDDQSKGLFDGLGNLLMPGDEGVDEDLSYAGSKWIQVNENGSGTWGK